MQKQNKQIKYQLDTNKFNGLTFKSNKYRLYVRINPDNETITILDVDGNKFKNAGLIINNFGGVDGFLDKCTPTVTTFNDWAKYVKRLRGII